MTDQEMRVAIAECCPNWTVHHGGRYCAITNCPNGPLRGRLFDPLNDLNAMAEAINTLTRLDRLEFLAHLDKITSDPNDKNDQAWLPLRILNCTARQRAEAFLRALGKWKDSAK